MKELCLLDRSSRLINIINMKKLDETAFTQTATEVCEILNISRQTLYAYVSRGKLRASAQKGDARKSLYHVHDIEKLLANKKRGRSRRAIAKSTQSWGEPVLKSDISHIDQGRLYYRGYDAVKISNDASFEDVAKLLINVDVSKATEHNYNKTIGRNPFVRMVTATANLVTSTHAIKDADKPAYILGQLLAAICDQTHISDEPFHIQLAKYFSDTEDFKAVTRRCLVLCADHELNPSAYTARVASSAHASLEACILAALSTFSGTRHGSMTSMTRWWVGRAAMKQSAEKSDFIKATKTPPGFGHPIYPNIDPRAEELLKYIQMPEGWADIIAEVKTTHNLYPNLDFALAAMEKSLGLKPKTGQTLFAFSRLIGWIAHSQEQRKSGQLIRPRAWS
jgi:citrate synthase